METAILMVSCEVSDYSLLVVVDSLSASAEASRSSWSWCGTAGVDGLMWGVPAGNTVPL